MFKLSADEFRDLRQRYIDQMTSVTQEEEEIPILKQHLQVRYSHPSFATCTPFTHPMSIVASKATAHLANPS
ncbi:unnamed protein product [Nippostrongylus brasiliensis]|uniref:Phenylacetate--CoA ligase n=1 Tax=Nippostrongylus brasiliensis TaxID=27835 RepID=A0A0N4XJ65_NIPBR|nr:unnamed protein product [Nippostrongylus brasiliensis]